MKKLLPFLFFTFCFGYFIPAVSGQLMETDLSWNALKQAYNEVQDKPLIISILGVNCPPCRVHRDDIRDQVMNQCDNPDLKWFIVWFEDPGHPALRSDAESQANLINDERVTQWWYNEHQSFTPKNDSIAYLFGDASWMGCGYAWDISMLFDPGASWESQPPQPNYCMAKVNGCCNFFNINNFVNAVIDADVCENTSALFELSQISNSSLLKCFPNPVFENITIQYRLPGDSGSLVIFDEFGNNLATYNLTKKEGELSISRKLVKGVYFFSLKTKSQILKFKKVVVLSN